MNLNSYYLGMAAAALVIAMVVVVLCVIVHIRKSAEIRRQQEAREREQIRQNRLNEAIQQARRQQEADRRSMKLRHLAEDREALRLSKERRPMTATSLSKAPVEPAAKNRLPGKTFREKRPNTSNSMQDVAVGAALGAAAAEGAWPGTLDRTTDSASPSFDQWQSPYSAPEPMAPSYDSSGGSLYSSGSDSGSSSFGGDGGSF